MRITIALFLVLLAHAAPLPGQICRVCQRAVSTGGGPHVTEPGQHPPPQGPTDQPHCIWTWDDNIGPPMPMPPSSTTAQSTGHFGTTPFAQAVADAAGAVLSADVQARSVSTRVTASDTDVGALNFYIKDTTMGCTCHTIPAILCSAFFKGRAAMRLQRQASPNSYLTLRADQLWASASGVSMGLHLDIQQTPIVMQTGQASGGLHFGPAGGTIGGGGFTYVLDPPPAERYAMDVDAGAAPGAQRDDGSIIGSVVAQGGLFFSGPSAQGPTSALEAAIEDYVASWTYHYHCPVCGTSGTAQFRWTE